MACCQCCCGGEECTDGQQGKCCCGGSEGACCSESEYCCSGECQPDPCDCDPPCDPGACEECVDGNCESTCDYVNCENCVDGECVGCPEGEICCYGGCDTPENCCDQVQCIWISYDGTTWTNVVACYEDCDCEEPASPIDYVYDYDVSDCEPIPIP